MARFGNPYTPVKTLFALAARTTNGSSGPVSGNGCAGIVVDINITAFTGTSITFTLEWQDPAAGNAWVTLLASAAKSATGRFSLTVDPRIATAANVSLQTGAKASMRLTTTGTITSVTYSAVATGIA
jgi:hypothetical protein